MTSRLHRLFELRHEAHLIACIAFLKMNWYSCQAQGEPLRVEIHQRGNRRTLEQNRRYWAVLNEIADQAWVDGKQYDADTWHEHFRRAFIGKNEVVMPSGEIIERGISTTTLNVSEFADFMGKIEAYAAGQLGVVLG